VEQDAKPCKTGRQKEKGVSSLTKGPPAALKREDRCAMEKVVEKKTTKTKHDWLTDRWLKRYEKKKKVTTTKCPPPAEKMPHGGRKKSRGKALKLTTGRRTKWRQRSHVNNSYT